ncbi:hypothetical protein EJ08DRAFT_701315 [Tothia fuscella]|uniref:Uncharacterized protein n=1 Tax=Tothia fuscella TaxID=1048955 RepID=A0A9P4NJ43_9PEZI|nr:hypothetical protein EJ08DRAFT_701315 [Tothia fuscella]
MCRVCILASARRSDCQIESASKFSPPSQFPPPPLLTEHSAPRVSFPDEGANLGKHRISLVLAPGLANTGPPAANIYSAFPYLPYVGRITTVCRLYALKYMIIEVNSWSTYLAHSVQYGTPKASKMAAARKAYLECSWRCLVRQTRQFTSMICLLESARLRQAESRRQYAALGSQSHECRHARLVWERIETIGHLVDEVLPLDLPIRDNVPALPGRFTDLQHHLYDIDKALARLIYGKTINPQEDLMWAYHVKCRMSAVLRARGVNLDTYISEGGWLNPDLV